MWEFADDGNLYFEKAVEFINLLFTEWKKAQTSHFVTIIFFSRTFLQVAADQARDWGQQTQEATHKDLRASETCVLQEAPDGRLYQDHYKVVINIDLGAREMRPRRGAAEAVLSSKQWGSEKVRQGKRGRRGQSRQKGYIETIKEEFNLWHRRLRWGITDPSTGLRRFPSNASDGNFMNAINCAVSVYQKHYRNRYSYCHEAM